MKELEKNFISAVIYVCNQEKHITIFLENLYQELKKIFYKFEIICVDDASNDNSVASIREAAKNLVDTNVSILKLSYFQGLESAMNAGVDLAIGDFVYEFDTIESNYDMALVRNVYDKALGGGYDIVCAFPSERMKVTSRFFYNIFNYFTANENHLKTETFRILSRRAINRVSDMNQSIPYRKAVYANCGLNMANVEYQSFHNHAFKKDRVNKKYYKELAIDSLILFTQVGYKFSMGLTIFMMIFAILMAIYASAVFVMSVPVTGWTTTILFMSFAFAGLFGILTIIIKYLSIIVELVYKKQKYRVYDIEKISSKSGL